MLINHKICIYTCAMIIAFPHIFLQRHILRFNMPFLMLDCKLPLNFIESKSFHPQLPCFNRQCFFMYSPKYLHYIAMCKFKKLQLECSDARHLGDYSGTGGF